MVKKKYNSSDYWWIGEHLQILLNKTLIENSSMQRVKWNRKSTEHSALKMLCWGFFQI